VEVNKATMNLQQENKNRNCKIRENP